MTPTEEILAKINNEGFYQSFYPDLQFNEDGEGANNVPCFMHNDSKPSLSINLNNGGHCKAGCKSFTDPIYFAYLHEKHTGNKTIKLDTIVMRMYDEHVRPLVKGGLVARWYDELQKDAATRTLLAKRHITGDLIKRFRLGYDPDDGRVCIPILNREGWVTDIRKVSLDKMVGVKNYPLDYNFAPEDKRGYAKGGRLFPMRNMNEQNITICEGEFDAMLLDLHGFNGVTAGGVTDWKKFAHLLKGKDVTIMFDNDNTKERNSGQECAAQLMKKLYPLAKTVRNVVLPSGDVTDWFVGGNSANNLRKLMDISEPEETPEPEVLPEDEPVTKLSTLAEIVDEKNFGKIVEVEGRLIGEKEEYYSLTKDYELKCGEDRGEMCVNCPMQQHKGKMKGMVVPGSDESISHIGAGDKIITASIISSVIPKKCSSISFRRINVTAVYTIAISPTMARDAKKSELDRFTVLTMTDRLEVNSEYTFRGRVTHNPNNQNTVFMVHEAKENTQSFRHFKVPTPDKRKDLHRKFTPDDTSVKGIIKKHDEINELLARNVTFIYGRPHLHTAIDLTFHSPLQVKFGNKVQNSYAEVAIIGDTNTGKNEVLDRLCDYYGSGLVVDSGSTTRAGLIGGSNPEGIFSWGLYVQQHGQLLGLDEGAHLKETIATLRCVREGKADVSNAHAKRQTACQTRLVILANDPHGSLSENAYPVQSLKALFTEGADISRFTYAYFMREEDVSAELLNGLAPDTIESDITQEDFQIRLNNAWAIHHTNIIIDEDATTAIGSNASTIAEKYSSKIPLIQRAIAKKKLLSWASALALTQYHMDESGEKLLITKEYVEAARVIVESHYDSDACQYDAFSEMEQLNESMADVKLVDDIFELEAEKTNGSIIHSIDHLLAKREIDLSTVNDAFIHCELSHRANNILKTLVVNRCINKVNKFYTKNKVFVEYLKEKKRQQKRKEA